MVFHWKWPSSQNVSAVRVQGMRGVSKLFQSWIYLDPEPATCSGALAISWPVCWRDSAANSLLSLARLALTEQGPHEMHPPHNYVEEELGWIGQNFFS